MGKNTNEAKKRVDKVLITLSELVLCIAIYENLVVAGIRR